MNRSRGNSSATVLPSRQTPSPRQPPVPSYSDAMGGGVQHFLKHLRLTQSECGGVQIERVWMGV
ncbi:hypothetical protein FVEG_16092 [Fusarium verticillioides 7600]|uniref:Uncharacterized protein n=1 Tax=Gibberella moniliformis (strain M3125 / FGSC 7600) TaxID=334819 RepID=W7MI49_GIBM7|nr:hypothetical protein FVEG_16092 [Fusarium verticillioides 7600]EWG47250.1 hypothetical protein FVEG_16092 [Fusarium verticillioides 7600]